MLSNAMGQQNAPFRSGVELIARPGRLVIDSGVMAGTKPNRAPRKNAPTPDQRRARTEMSTLSAAWDHLTEEQRVAWGERARTDRRGGVAARSRRRSGRRAFFKANSHRLALSLGLLTDPPDSAFTASMPMGRLVITNRGGRIALKVRLIHGHEEGVMVSSWHPQNAGAMKWAKFVRIGLLPAPERGLSDITRQYVAKFGVPAVGKKVFIRLQQMSDYLGTLVYTTRAIVPEEEGWPREPKAQ
jgi:hypothetical protein